MQTEAVHPEDGGSWDAVISLSPNTAPHHKRLLF